jgi:hypothetical protein
MRRFALAMALAAVPALLSCGGSAAKSSSGPDRPGGALGGDSECCCQHFDETGRPTGVAVSDSSACKSTGGNCLDSNAMCEEE